MTEPTADQIGTDVAGDNHQTGHERDDKTGRQPLGARIQKFRAAELTQTQPVTGQISQIEQPED